MERLEGGVLLSFGSAIMAPEVYLKALAMARNVARQEGREIRALHHRRVRPGAASAGDVHRELPKTDPGYYFRPYKTILVRTVADGGESFYFRGDHRATLPALRRARLLGGGYDRAPDDPDAPCRHAVARWWWAISASTAGAPTIPPPRSLRAKPASRASAWCGSEVTPGAGGTVANNLAALGVGRVAVLGVIGDDGFGLRTRRAPWTRAASARICWCAAPSMQTFTYTKVINCVTGEEDRPRLDFINTAPLAADVERRILDALQNAVDAFDVILVSDQAETSQGGVVTPAVRELLAELAPDYPDKICAGGFARARRRCSAT